MGDKKLDLELRNRLAFVMAEAIEEEKAMASHLQPAGQQADYGLAAADGTISGMIAAIIEYADWCSVYIRAHGFEAVGLAAAVVTLWEKLSEILEKRRAHAQPDEKEAMLRALVKALLEEIERRRR